MLSRRKPRIPGMWGALLSGPTAPPRQGSAQTSEPRGPICPLAACACVNTALQAAGLPRRGDATRLRGCGRPPAGPKSPRVLRESFDALAASRVLRLVRRRCRARHHDRHLRVLLLQPVDSARCIRGRAWLPGRCRERRHRHLLHCGGDRRPRCGTSGGPFRRALLCGRRRAPGRTGAGLCRLAHFHLAALCVPRRAGAGARYRRAGARDDRDLALVQRVPVPGLLDRHDRPVAWRHPGGAAPGAVGDAVRPRGHRAMDGDRPVPRHRPDRAAGAAAQPAGDGAGAGRPRPAATRRGPRRGPPFRRTMPCAAAISTPSPPPTSSCSEARWAASPISTGSH